MKFELSQEIFDNLRAVCVEIKRNKEKLTVTEIMMKMMDMEGMFMHCPYHHFVVPAAMLTQAAIAERKTDEEFDKWLTIAEERAKTVPAGFCGECGTCGAAVGIGMFISIYTGATPKSIENWQWANEATGICLQKIAVYPGPRCCKRTAFIAVNAAVTYVNEKCGTTLSVDENTECKYHDRNAECLESKCPFYKGDK